MEALPQKRKTSRSPLSTIIRPAYIILALIIIFFDGKVFSTKGNFIGGYDVADYFFWQESFIKEQLLSGSIPLWNPYYYSGHPFVANPQTFVFYPATLLYLALPLPLAFNIDTLLHLYLAAMGIYCFVFIITESKTAGLAAATVYSFSGYFMDNIFAGHLTMLHTAALMPWLFYFVEKAFRTEQPFFLSVSGLVLGLQILSGEPQNSYYTVLFLTVYFFIRYFSACRTTSPKLLKWFAIYFPLILIVASGISAIQILPSAELMSLSDRAQNTYEFATFMSFPPQNFFTFLVAKPREALLNTNWEFGGYMGILSAVLAAMGMVFSKHRRYSYCFGIIAVIAVTIMLGSYTPIYHFYFKHLPGISTFRIPARCLVVFVFSMAILVGLGIRQLCESHIPKRQQIFMMAVLAILLIALFVGADVLHISLTSREILLAIGFIIAASIILNLRRFTKNAHLVPCCLIIVLFADLYLTYAQQVPEQSQNELLQKNPAELLFEQDIGFYRVNLPFGALRGMKLAILVSTGARR